MTNRKKDGLVSTLTILLLPIVILFIAFCIMMEIDSPHENIHQQDCYEDGHCREGLTTIQGEVVTKDWCKEHKANWKVRKDVKNNEFYSCEFNP